MKQLYHFYISIHNKIKKIVLIFLLMVLCVCASASEKKYYIVEGEHASCYHFFSSCITLENRTFKEVSESTVIAMNRRPCKLCVRKIAKQSTNNVILDEKNNIHFNIKCPKINGKPELVADSIVEDPNYNVLFCDICLQIDFHANVIGSLSHTKASDSLSPMKRKPTEKKSKTKILFDNTETYSLEWWFQVCICFVLFNTLFVILSLSYRHRNLQKKIKELEKISSDSNSENSSSTVETQTTIDVQCNTEKNNQDSNGTVDETVDSKKTIYSFLELFGKHDVLKYTTHEWERLPNSNEYIFSDYDKFREEYSKSILIWENTITKENPELWLLIKNFLLNDEGQNVWGEHKIHIGHNIYVSNWMKSNPGKQPFNMPLTEFPESLRPGLINNKTLYSFNDIVELFKHSIEFRDDRLYTAVKKIFIKNKSFNLDREKLTSLQGITFYTHTMKVKDAIEKIASNIFSRSEYPNIEISCQTKDQCGMSSIRLEILQIGSFSYKEITHPRVSCEDENCLLAKITKQLKNLCDFAIESKFKENGKLKNMHH